ncbi:MAG: hypothetical protein K6G23_08260 [Lachnospiraceae bacterium]|nr:hypothetical protein [Lachnospiraceae bacterium]
MKRMVKKLAMAVVSAMLLTCSISTVMTPQTVLADDTEDAILAQITNFERSKADGIYTLNSYANNLILVNKLDAVTAQQVLDIASDAVTKITDGKVSSESELETLISNAEAQMDALVKNVAVATSGFISLTDTFETKTVRAGETITLTLPVVSYAKVSLFDIVVTPQISNLVAEWPFEPSTGEAATIAAMPPYDNTVDLDSVRQDISFTFKVRSDVYTGYYPLKFNYTYNRNGNVEEGTFTAYIKTIGGEEAGKLDATSSTAIISQPRIIVTGFTTTPDYINAGDTFTVNINIQNTSKTETIRNVLFDLQAVVESTTNSTTSSVAVFLPTSGASSIYYDKIGPGETIAISMEMNAKNDLTEKPYVLSVNVKYDTENATNLTDTANISIPVHQEARCENSSFEISPEAIEVGEQSNVMFSVYNTGKTTLNNTWVKFKADSISGGDTYLGNLAPGATGSVDAMITGAAATMDDGTVTVEISYEDDAGNVSTIERTMNLMVSEVYIDDYNWSEGDMGEEVVEEESGSGAGRIGLIIAALVIVALIVVLIIFKKRKAKKQALKEAQEADELVNDLVADEEKNKEE